MKVLRIGLVAVIPLLGPATVRAQAGGGAETGITVTATGTVTVAPDRATVRVAIESRGARAAVAGQENARVAAQVRDTLARLGFPRDSVVTADYSVSPVHDYETRDQRVVGYQARMVLSIRVHDLARVGPVIDAALGAGGTAIEQVWFESSRADAARIEALSRAVETARLEAEAIARAAGGALGVLLDATTASGGTPMGGFADPRALRAQEATEVSPGDLTVTATVTARWAFLPAG
jgi:uncharacterized protein YggE